MRRPTAAAIPLWQASDMWTALKLPDGRIMSLVEPSALLVGQ